MGEASSKPVERPLLQMPDNSGNNTILIISHIHPAFPSAGNERRLFNLVRWMRQKGYRVELLLNSVIEQNVLDVLNGIFDGVHTLSSLSIIDKIRASNLSQTEKHSHPTVNKLSPVALSNLTHKLCEQIRPIAVIAEYIFSAPCLAFVQKGVLKIIDTHDVYSLRKPEEIHYCSSELERELLLYADVIMAIQSDETRIFTELVPERKSITVGVDIEVVHASTDANVQNTTILLVGSDNDANIDGLHQFFCYSWPRIRTVCQSARLRIIGKVGNNFSCVDDRIERAGWVMNLDEEYARAAVVINPTVYGTGLKIKTVEALCHAKALVATSNSVAGLPVVENPPCLVSDDWNEFANHVISLVNDSAMREGLQERAACYAQEMFSPERVYAELAEVMQEHRGKIV